MIWKTAFFVLFGLLLISGCGQKVVNNSGVEKSQGVESQASDLPFGSSGAMVGAWSITQDSIYGGTADVLVNIDIKGKVVSGDFNAVHSLPNAPAVHVDEGKITGKVNDDSSLSIEWKGEQGDSGKATLTHDAVGDSLVWKGKYIEQGILFSLPENMVLKSDANNSGDENGDNAENEQAFDEDSKLLYFVPDDWNLERAEKRDLDKDGKTDTVMILRDPKMTDTGDNDRRLVILFGIENGAFKKVLSSDKVIMCTKCGGVFGDPLSDLKIENGVLIIEHYGGSRNRWGYVDKFRWQNGHFYLIGRTITEADNLLMTSKDSDYNLLTGDYTIAYSVPEKYDEQRSSYSEEEQKEIDPYNKPDESGKIKVKPLIKMEDFDINSES